jgi:hypothetical protein
MPTACHGWAETMAASRLLNTPDMSAQAIWSGHTHATLERLRTQAVVLLVQDTTCLHDGTTQPQAGMGTVKSNTRAASRLQPTVALTPERVHVGGMRRMVWQRPAQPVAQQRKRTPLEEQESDRWLEGYQGACAVKQAGPATLVVHRADRAGDLQEWLMDGRRREPGQRAEWIIRAQADRRLAPGAAPRYWWAERPQTCALGPLPIDLARQPERPPRPVTLAVTAQPVTCYGARRPGGKLPPVTVRAVYAQELNPPAGEESGTWLLRTSRPVTDLPRAGLGGPWYRCRWDIARFVRALQQGCQIEPLRVQTDQRFLNALAIDVIVAWRIHTITMAGRAYPAMSCEVVFEPRAWHTLETLQHHCHPPPPPPPLREMVRSLAPLGGFFARTRDGEPGIQAIWQGDQRLHEFIGAIETYRTVHAGERNVSC